MYTLKFTLKQHTPLIHFQHDQAGATLRATEVKPKLDRFIIEKLTGQKGEKAFDLFKANPAWKNWLVGNGDHPALDYKMSIVGQQSSKYVIACRLSEKQRSAILDSFKYIPESAFFAEEKSIGVLFNEKGFGKEKTVSLKEDYPELLGNISKQGIVNTDDEKNENDVHIKIISFNSNLLKEIKNNLILFFLSENFGCRQNKGFGCFSVNEIEGKEQLYNVTSTLKKLFDYVYCKSSPYDFSQALSVIQKDYKLLKAGKGRKEGYAKSKLFLYFANKNIRWEKRWIKQEYYKTDKIDFPNKLTVDLHQSPTEPIDINLKNDWDDTKHPKNSLIEYQYIRALLGLAEQFEFQTTSDDNKKFVVQIGSESNQIQRFKSPITFKFINGNIYLLANKIIKCDKTPLGEGIEFTFRIKDRQNKMLETPNLQIPNAPLIPSTFDIEEFIDFAIKDSTDNAIIGKYIKVLKP